MKILIVNVDLETHKAFLDQMTVFKSQTDKCAQPVKSL